MQVALSLSLSFSLSPLYLLDDLAQRDRQVHVRPSGARCSILGHVRESLDRFYDREERRGIARGLLGIELNFNKKTSIKRGHVILFQ